MSIRIGGVPFGVGAPLLCGLEAEPEVALVTAPPAALVRLLRAGELDAALISSIEAWRRPGYRVLGELGIAAAGPVRSVRAFRRPGTTVRTIGVDTGSETSVALLKILLARVLGGPGVQVQKLERIEPTLRPDELPHDLVLLIGDHGLNADPGGREAIDLGEQWQRWTGLPFVFALWLLAPRADAERVVPRLRAARELARVRQVDDGTRGAVHYELGAREWSGLARFREEALALGLVDATIEPVILGGVRA